MLLSPATHVPCVSSDDRAYERLAQSLKSGEAAIFPTDTVYGIGLALAYVDSPQEIFRLKRRPQTKPVAWLCSDMSMLEQYIDSAPDYAYAYAQAFWPGALTLVLPANNTVKPCFSSSAHAIGVRIPNHKALCDLMRELNSPLVTSSANISGLPSASCYDELDPAIREAVSVCLLEDAPLDGRASTVIDCTQDTPRILREGALSASEIRRVYPL